MQPFSKSIVELQLFDVKSIIICEDSSRDESYEDLNIEIVNIKEWLLDLA